LIGGLRHYIRYNDRVLLKPNLNGVEGCTDLTVTGTLIQMLSDLGARVFIAESTFGDSNMTNVFFQKTGYSELAARYGIRLFNLNDSESVEVTVDRPRVLNTIRIAKEVYDADKIINLPNMKVHYATGITLSLKNLKGLLVGSEKRHFHEIGLDHAIVDLNNTVRPHLNIVGGISCMERMGPRGGDIVKLNLLIAGENAAEVDYVGMSVMGYTLEEVRHLQYYIESNSIDINSIETVGETIENVKYPFKKVRLENIIPSNFRIHNQSACSACMNAFLRSCSLLDNDPDDFIEIYMGSTIPMKEASVGKSVAFGNCCPTGRDFDIKIKGCPPYPFALKEQINRSSHKPRNI
jgi:uncharacterized protein (DUF362 family)